MSENSTNLATKLTPAAQAIRPLLHWARLPVIALLLLILLQTPTVAQAFDAEVDFFIATPEEAMPFTVGDRITLRLEVRHPIDSRVTLPVIEEEWGDFEVIDQTEPATERFSDGVAITRKDIVVSLFEPGSYQTPRLVVTHFKADGTSEELGAPVIPIKIESVLVEGDNTLRDLKAQVAMAVPPLWPWILAGFLLTLFVMGAIAGTGLWFYHRRRQQALVPEAAVPIVDPRPPEVIAYAELDRIEALDLPAKNQFKEHYSLVTDCLRRYIEGRYKIHALERTTDELRTSFRRSTVPLEVARRFVSLFAASDLVKFARFKPQPHQAYRLLEQARDIVQETTPLPEPTPPPSQESVPEVES